jgi:hypothetical protein
MEQDCVFLFSSMVKYFPFTSSFDLKMGTAPMKENDTVIETDESYLSEINLKRSLLIQDHPYYFNSLPGSEQAEWNAFEKIIDDLVKFDPYNFSIEKKDLNWMFVNRLLKESYSFVLGDNASLPLSPLDWIGRHVQEDLIILNSAGEVVAGQLCFPSGWALHEKISKQFMEVHAPLPSVTNPMIQSANKLLERLPMNKPIARNNWGFRLGDQLDLSSKYSEVYRKKLSETIPLLSISDLGEQIFLRIEHQTLTRLASGFILFTIHTYHSSLSEECLDQQRAQTMLSFLQSTPADLIEYKVMTPFYKQLIEYLQKSTAH